MNLMDRRKSSCVARSVLNKRGSETLMYRRKFERPMDVEVLKQRLGSIPSGLTALVPLEFQDLPYDIGIMWLPPHE